MFAKYGYIDQKGNIVIEPQFNIAYDFHEGLACVMKSKSGLFFDPKGKWGYVDKIGKIVIEAQFTYGDNFSEGIAVVSKDNLADESYGYINKLGNFIAEPQLKISKSSEGKIFINEIYSFSEGMARIKMNGKYGYMAMPNVTQNK